MMILNLTLIDDVILTLTAVINLIGLMQCKFSYKISHSRYWRLYEFSALKVRYNEAAKIVTERCMVILIAGLRPARFIKPVDYITIYFQVSK